MFDYQINPGQTGVTSIPANVGDGKKPVLVMWGWHYDAGDATTAGIDLVRLGYSGDHATGTTMAALNNGGRLPSYSVVNGYLAVTMPAGVAEPRCTVIY